MKWSSSSQLFSLFISIVIWFNSSSQIQAPISHFENQSLVCDLKVQLLEQESREERQLMVEFEVESQSEYYSSFSLINHINSKSVID